MNVKQGKLERMIRARHIVFIGSRNLISQGIQNCRKINFQGKIYAVHKTATAIDDVRCYNHLHELPEVPDAAFIAVRGESAIHLVKELQLMGVCGCVCYAAGFSEIGNDDLHRELVEAAGDMALVGPNCYGIINFLDQIPLWPDHFGSTPTEKGVAVISQSGNLSFNITMNDRSLPLAYIIDIGNQALLDISDYIKVLCEDPRVTAIGLHIEGINNMEKFIQAVKIALNKGIPIVALKTGVSEIGSQLTMSHTSSLAGSDDLYQALFRRLNICRVESLTAFLETLKLFAVTGPLKGRKLGVLTCSGGESAITADIAEQNGFQLPKLSAKQKAELRTQLTKFEHVSNPLDYNTSIWGNEEKLMTCFTSFMQEQFDTTLLILDYLDKDNLDRGSWEAAINAFIQVRNQMKSQAIVISILPEGMPAYFREKLISSGITPLQGITDAFTAISAAVSYYERKSIYNSIPGNLLLSDQQLTQNNTVILNEWQGKQELQSYGLKLPKGKVVSLRDPQILDADMKAPFVVKGLSTKVVHKSDIGGVKLNLRSEQEVRAAMIEMYRNLSHELGEDMRFLVEEMVADAVAELNIGIKRDDQFGLALVISMGGELVNLMNDSIPVLLPASREEILEALLSLRGIKLLQGFRGRMKGDIEAAVQAAETIGVFAEANRDNILEMDVNPLLVLPEGQGTAAVDAFIRRSAADISNSGVQNENLASL